MSSEKQNNVPSNKYEFGIKRKSEAFISSPSLNRIELSREENEENLQNEKSLRIKKTDRITQETMKKSSDRPMFYGMMEQKSAREKEPDNETTIKIASLESAYEEASKNLFEAQELEKKLQKEVETQKERICYLEEENTKFQGEIKKVNESMKTSSKDIKNMKEQISEMRESEKKLKDELNKKCKIIDQNEKSLYSEKEIEERRNTLEEDERLIKQLRLRSEEELEENALKLSKIQQEIVSSKECLMSFSEKINEDETKCRELEEKIKEMQNNLENLNEELKDKKLNFYLLTNENERLLEEKKSIIQKNEELQARFDKEKKIWDEYQSNKEFDENKRLKMEIALLKRQIESYPILLRESLEKTIKNTLDEKKIVINAYEYENESRNDRETKRCSTPMRQRSYTDIFSKAIIEVNEESEVELSSNEKKLFEIFKNHKIITEEHKKGWEKILMRVSRGSEKSKSYEIRTCSLQKSFSSLEGKTTKSFLNNIEDKQNCLLLIKMRETNNVIALFWGTAFEIERGFLASVTNAKIFNTKKANFIEFVKSNDDYLHFGNGEIKICQQDFPELGPVLEANFIRTNNMFKALDDNILFGNDPKKKGFIIIDLMELYEIGLKKIEIK